MNYKDLTKLIAFSVSLLFLSSFLRSENLQEVYELALKNDPLLKAAEASYRAGKENKVQGRAGLLPSLSVSGSTSWNEYRVADQIIDQYNSSGYSANISQPLFRMDKWFQFRRGKALSKSAEAEFAYQQQETMIRVASAYFNVLNSIDSLNAALAEEKAIGRQKDLAKKRFEVGLAAITEVQETQAAYDLTVVAKISREAQLDTARETLSSIVGKDITLLSPLKEAFEISLPNPLDRDSWVSMGLNNNFQLKSAKLQRDAAKSSARSAGSNHLPNIDIVGRASKSTSKQGKFGGFIQNPLFGIEQDTRQYAIQVNWPLYAGGSIRSARRQAYANYDRSKEQAIYTERSTIRDVRSNHFGVQTQVANVTARKQALASAESALEATQVGYEVGTRNTVDLLDSQKRLYQAQRDYASSRYEYIIAMLRLKASVGSLNPGDLISISDRME
ncbi:MAG: transporter [Gammaproteobacteria bacterium]|nr:transporter [Gammaproteobacteria bacterium]HJM59180.1 TolC family outer membrane protein [SAR86 cluster bacterium]|tara:strand:- start:2692 stop:4029 length:1338 start_codon:yes stop_codon:yes gene_type:complete